MDSCKARRRQGHRLACAAKLGILSRTLRAAADPRGGAWQPSGRHSLASEAISHCESGPHRGWLGRAGAPRAQARSPVRVSKVARNASDEPAGSTLMSSNFFLPHLTDTVIAIAVRPCHVGCAGVGQARRCGWTQIYAQTGRGRASVAISCRSHTADHGAPLVVAGRGLDIAGQGVGCG